MKHITKPLSILLALCLIAGLLPWTAMPVRAANGTLSGSGTEESPYIIEDNDDWSTFAANVNAGTNADAYYKLSDSWDNSANAVTTTVGTSDHKFSGTFDGNGKTLTLNLTASTDNCAPFGFIEGATIKDLTIAGSVTTTAKYAASVAAHTYGTTSITNCHSTVTITGDNSGDGTHGGFVAVNQDSATLNFSGCSFKGKMLGSSATSNGGFVGWNSGTKINYTDCLFAPSEITMSASSSCTFNRNGKNSFNSTYCTQAFGTAEGTRVYTSAPSDVMYGSVIATDNQSYYAPVAVSGINAIYLTTGGNIHPEPTVTAVDGTVLTKGTHYTVNYSSENDSNTGSYTLTVSGTGGYTGSQTFNYTVRDADLTISSADNWNQFAENVNNGTDNYQDKFVQMTANINGVTTMVGVSDHRFKGTFDGNGKTLTLNLTASTDDCAPFGYLEGATIKDLTIAGSVTTSKKYAASIAAHTYGTTSITNCHSTVTITGDNSGDGTHGGFVAVNQDSATLNFSGCSFKGKMLGSSATSNGGFVGWNSGTKINYTDCLFAPSEITMSASSSCTFNRNGKNSFTSVYYTAAFGEAQGTPVYISAPSDMMYNPVTAIDGNPYYAAITISGVKARYLATGSENRPEPLLTAGDGTVLAKGVDYTAAWSGDGKESGSYTVTVSAVEVSGYFGSQVIPYQVSLTQVTDENGTYYAIGSLADLKFFTAYVNDLNSNDACKGMTFKLTAGIGSDDAPVGEITPARQFAGNFDGGGYTITGMVINGRGLFHNNYGGKVENLTLKDVSVNSTASGTLPDNVGGICGWGNCSILNCHVTGKINGNHYVGGLMGSGGNTLATISGCSFSGTVYATAAPFGGIIGRSSCSISDCTVTNAELSGLCYAGAITGRIANSDPSVTNCKAANVTITTTTTEDDQKRYTGALVGCFDTTSNISCCVYENINGALGAVGNCQVNNEETYNYDGDSTRRYTVHLGEGVSAAYQSGTTYDVGGVTCYDAGAKFTLSANEESDFDSYVVTDGAGNDITATVLVGNTLTMPENTSIAVRGTYDTTTEYAVGVFNAIENGSVIAKINNTEAERAHHRDTVTLTVTPAAGYAIDTVSYNDGSDHTITPVEGVYSFTMPAANVTVSATFKLIPAIAPTITTQPGNLSLTYGYTTGNTLTVAASSVEGQALSYQWYNNTVNSSEGGTAIDGATAASFTVPIGRNTGAAYYYCVMTATRTDNSQTASATSNVVTVTVSPKTVAIPTAATGLKWTGSNQTGVAEGDGYTVTNGAKTDVGNYTATATLADTTNYKWSDDTTENKTISWSIDKADGPDAPTGLAGVAPTTDGGSDGMITGVDTTMEYSSDSVFSSTTACTGTEITGLTAGTYYVRVATTETHEAGTMAAVEVPAYVATTYAVTYKVVNGTWSDGTTADKTETVTSGTHPSSVPTGMIASSGYTGGAWNTDPTAATITEATTFTYTFGTIPTYAVTITAGANMTTTGNASQTVNAGSTMTSVVYTADEGYYFPEGYSVAAVNGVTVMRNGWTQITVSGTPTAAASITLTDATAKAKETTPTASFAADGADTGTLSGLVSGGQYAITGATSATFTASGTTQALTGVSAGTLSIVKKGNGTTTTDSDAQEITVTQSGAPTAGKVDCTTSANNDGKLTGVTAEMEYKKSDATSWTGGTGSDITGLANGTYYVRVKASGTALASANQTLTIAAYTAPNQVAAPTFSLAAGNYTGTQSVEISCATDGATIHYTTDGTTPTTSSTAYADAVTVSGTTTIKAIAVKDGMANSTVAEAIYTIVAPTYTVTVENGTTSDSPAAEGATVTITANAPASGKVFDKWTTNDGVTFASETSITTTFTMPAKAVTVTATYKDEPTYTLSVTAPVFDAVTVGYTQPEAKAITVTSTGNSNATISGVALSGTNASSFTLVNGTASVTAGGTNTTYTIQPNAGLAAGTYAATITVTYNGSATAAANVSFTVNAMETVATPTFSPAGGTFTSAQSVTITCSTSGATIHYTTDGSTPTASSPTYSTAISVSATTTIKAIAVKSGMTDSSVVSATYTIQTAPKTYAVTVNSGSGSGNYAAGATVTIKANDPATGKVFDKWTCADGVSFASATSATTTFTMLAKAVTVTATYKNATYKVTLNTNGGTINSGNVTSYTYGTGATLPTNVTKDGSIFGGWYEKSDFSGNSVTAISKTDTGNKTFYAKWNSMTYSVSGSFDNSGKLVATVTAPKDSVLIAASYKSTGQQADIKTYGISAAMNGETHTFNDLTMGSDFTYKLMLVDSATYAPLCAAWGN